MRRGFGIAVVDDPAARAVLLPIVAVAGFVLADELAGPPGPEAGAERLAVPPGEELQEKGLHRRSSSGSRGWSATPPARGASAHRLPAFAHRRDHRLQLVDSRRRRGRARCRSRRRACRKCRAPTASSCTSCRLSVTSAVFAVGRQRLRVEAEVARHFERLGAGRLAGPREQLEMEVEVALGREILDGDRRCGLLRPSLRRGSEIP